LNVTETVVGELAVFSEFIASYWKVAVAVPLVGGDAIVTVKEPSGFRRTVPPAAVIVWAVEGQLVAPTGTAHNG
jgi:hypothetical protein